MKTLFKILTLGILLTAFSALTFAQDGPTLEELYNKYREAKKKPCGERGEVVTVGKSIVEKYSDDKDNPQIAKFVKDDYPKIEAADLRCTREKRYNESYKGQKWDDFLTVSKELMADEKDPNLGLDLLLTHTSTSYDRVVEGKEAYNNDTLSYAKTALQKIDEGKTSKTTKWGVFAPFGNKGDAQAWLNFMIADITYNKQKQQKAALPYYYKATQVGTEKKNDVSIYYNIGNYYFDEAAKLDTQYREAFKANNNEENDDTKKLLGLARGNADRGIDAFGRAYNIAKSDPKIKAEQKAALLKTLTDLYKFRFNIAATEKTPNLDSYVASQISKPMPDPASEVTPVIEEVKPATTTTTSTTPTTTPTTTTTTKPTTPTTTKPVTTTKPSTTTKPATSSTKPETTTEATTTKAKTTVKKPVTKKKGTR